MNYAQAGCRVLGKMRKPAISVENGFIQGKYMAIDMEAVRAQQRELNRVSDEVSSIRRKLDRHQDMLDDAWKSAEIRGIDSAIEDIVHRLNRLARDLEDLGHDVMVAGEEIKAEEDAAAEEAIRLTEDGKI